MQKTEFKVKVGDEELGYVVRLPDSKLRKSAREYKNDFFRKNAFKEGVYFQHQIQDLLKKKGLWTDEKEEEIKRVSREIEDKLKTLQKGKSESVPTAEALKEIIVKQVKPLRNKQLELLAERSQLDSLSLESEAQQIELDYLVAASTYTDMDDKVFSSIEDFREKEDTPYAEMASRKLAELIGLSNPNWLTELQENKLLIRHKFMNAEGRYIDKDGNFVSSDGKPVDKDGYYINAEGKRIDEDGNLINEDGEITEFTPFD